MSIFEPVASLFLKKHLAKKRGKKLHIYNFLKFILTTITKNDARGAKIDFLEFWFFCWVGNLTYYEHLKRFVAIQKNELAVTIVSHVKILISGQIIIWLIFQKMMLWAQKSTFLSSDFFAESHLGYGFFTTLPLVTSLSLIINLSFGNLFCLIWIMIDGVTWWICVCWAALW